jgi:hypothetical protein
MTTGSMQLFQVLKARLVEREAESLVNYVDTTLKENNKIMHEINLRTLATKEDLANLKGILKEDLANLKGSLETKIGEVKSDVIRWTFAFFVTMMLAILGLYLKK